MVYDPESTAQELRTLLQTGITLGESLRILHHEHGRGLMFLWPAVMAVRQLSKDEAMRLVIRETSTGRD